MNVQMAKQSTRRHVQRHGNTRTLSFGTLQLRTVDTLDTGEGLRALISFFSGGAIIKQVKLSQDISLSGNDQQIAKAQKILEPMLKQLNNINEYKARIFLQDLVDSRDLYASILYRGSQIWSRKRIINNLNRIIAKEQLYNNKNVRWVRLNSHACLPEVPKTFNPILSEYFYNFLTLCCGSEPHYSRAGWIGIYPTLQHLKRFFMQNEHGKPVSDYIPDWKTDAKQVVDDIERMLYPFRTYIKAKQKEERER